jgi:hypothetical protein
MDRAGETRNVHKIFTEKSLIEHDLGGPRSRCDNNIGKDVREVSFENANRIRILSNGRFFYWQC